MQVFVLLLISFSPRICRPSIKKRGEVSGSNDPVSFTALRLHTCPDAAGRDGAAARCLLYYGRDDCGRLEYLARRNVEALLASSTASAGGKRPLAMVSTGGMPAAAPVASADAGLAALAEVSKFCEVPQCRRLAILRHFGEPTTHIGCSLAAGQALCDFCASPTEVAASSRCFAESAPDRGRPLDGPAMPREVVGAAASDNLGLVDPGAYYHGVARRSGGAPTGSMATGLVPPDRESPGSRLSSERDRVFQAHLQPACAHVPMASGAAVNVKARVETRIHSDAPPPPPASGAARLLLRLAQLREGQG